MPILRFLPRVTPLEPAPSLDALLVALSSRPGLVVLDGRGAAQRAPWTLIGFDPVPSALAPLPERASELGAFATRLAGAVGDALPGPFQGGFLGALSYDLGVEGEHLSLPSDPWGVPRLVGGLYVDFAVFEHAHGAHAARAWLVLADEPGDGRPPLAARRARLLDDLAERDALPPPCFEALGSLVRRVPPAEHCRRIAALREQIAAGELYQANLAHAFAGRTRGRPLDLHRQLRRTSPAPHGGFLAWDEAEGRAGTTRGALISASPELLLEVEGDQARTQPIKGTAPRSDDARRDARLARDLLASAKDQAELAMIVDLVRNDLGRVARAGGVWVEDFPRLRSFPGVHHLTGDVRARLAPDKGAAQALAALFPGGSISGAPKLRAMQAIAALEGEGRGFFTGSLGFLDRAGHAVFDVLIRTFQWRPLPPHDLDGADGEVVLHVGGGITWSSRAQEEDEETLVKAARLLAALAPSRSAAPVLGAP